jgi:hypothetical protein
MMIIIIIIIIINCNWVVTRLQWQWWCKRDARLDYLWVMIYFVRRWRARFLKISHSRFKASRGWAIRFMCWMGLALWCRMTICQKLPKDFEQKLLNYQW